MSTAPEDDEDVVETTTETGVRWNLLASFVGLVYLVSVPTIIGLAGAGEISLEVVTQAWFLLYSTIAMMASVWLFGADTLEAVRKYRE